MYYTIYEPIHQVNYRKLQLAANCNSPANIKGTNLIDSIIKFLYNAARVV